MLEIFQYEFMVRAFIAGSIIAIIAPLIGIFLVLKRYSLMADTLAHVSLVGIAFGILTKTPVHIAAFVTALLASLGIEKLRSSKKMYGESTLALFLSGSLAVAVVLVSMGKGINADLLSFLFGSITTVSYEEVILMGMIGTVVSFSVIAIYRQLFFVSFDEELAQASGIKTKYVNLYLIVLTAATVSIAMRMVGVLLVGALMVIPVLTAFQISKSFRESIIFSVIISVFAVISGLYLSFYFDLASGGTVVLILIGMFILSYFLN